jgi:hypothetical protein
MQMRTIVVFLVGCAALIWFGLLYVSGTNVGWELARPFSAVVGCVTALALLFEVFLWRLPLVRSLVARRPSIMGTWRTVLESNFRQPDGNKTVKTVYVVIHQSLTRLSVRMYTDTAHSKSLAERISSSDNDDVFDLAVVYQNYPDIDQRAEDDQADGKNRGVNQSKIHFGALHIPNLNYKPSTLRGHYWTDRRTEGLLKLEERRSKLVNSYEEGVKLFSVPERSFVEWIRSCF